MNKILYILLSLGIIKVCALSNNTIDQNKEITNFRYGGYICSPYLDIQIKEETKTGEVIIEMLYVLEQNFYENDKIAFEATYNKLKKYLNSLYNENFTNSSVLYSGLIFESLVRLQESNISQSKWITKQILLDLLPDRKILKEYNGDLYLSIHTYINMLLIAQRITEYQGKNGKFPESLSILELPEILSNDGWGGKIIYCPFYNNYFLKSFGANRKDDGFDIEKNIPNFRNNADLVYYPGLSQRRKKLLEQTTIKMSGLELKLNKQTGQLTSESTN